ncbi:hypothetical protein ACIQBJ_26425 [Kitasatospora sp. NPDC088391]|uniref:hypothetical protein n=1 Tax=Kitasatospora sp. NPDC088391 TaxID=3364074 RepID=UPI003813B8EC
MDRTQRPTRPGYPDRPGVGEQRAPSGHPVEQPGLPGSPTGTVPGRPDRSALLADARPYCLRHALVLAGPDALRRHGLRAPVRDTDLLLISADGAPLADLAAGLAAALRAVGHDVREAAGTPRRHHLTVTDGARRALGIELRREPLRHPPVPTGLSAPPVPSAGVGVGAPVLVAALEDAAALAVRTLCERALPADLFALYALSTRFREGELLALAAASDEEVTADTLAERLETAAALLPPGAEEARRWAETWAQDLRLDLLETVALADGLYDPYLAGAEEPDGVEDAADSDGAGDASGTGAPDGAGRSDDL